MGLDFVEFVGVAVVPPWVWVVGGPAAGDCDEDGLRSGDGGGLRARVVFKVIGPVVHGRKNGWQLSSMMESGLIWGAS